MKLISGGLVKVIEFDKGLIVLHYTDGMMQRPGTTELAVMPVESVGEFLSRYLHARTGGPFAAAGKSVEESLKQALEGAVVLKHALQEKG
jgi:hypothetical protein